MSDTKFTPGNWQFRIEQIVPTSRETCFTVATDDFDIVSPMLGIRREQDAHLMAAAKKLYEALTRCKFDSLNMTFADLEFCEAAMAKARGEKS